MKKRTINKSTLLLAFLAVACWCFYFWKKDRDIETIAYNQTIISETVNYEIHKQNNSHFLEEVKNSWANYAMYSDTNEYKKYENKLKLFSKMLNNSVQDAYYNYLTSLDKVEQELFYTNKFSQNELMDFSNSYKKEVRKKDLALVNEKLNHLQEQSTVFEKANFHKIDWDKSNDLELWLDIIQHKKEVIELTNSIFEKNKKNFPTSFESNNFEGYSTLIPDYKNQKMIVKVFYFQSDTKYGTEFQKRLPKYLIASYNPFELGDSTFYPMQNPRTYHVFNDIGDTTLHLYFLNKETGKRFAKHSNYGIEFRVIPKK